MKNPPATDLRRQAETKKNALSRLLPKSDLLLPQLKTDAIVDF